MSRSSGAGRRERSDGGRRDREARHPSAHPAVSPPRLQGARQGVEPDAATIVRGGEAIIEEQSEGEEFYVILSGEVEVSKETGHSPCCDRACTSGNGARRSLAAIRDGACEDGHAAPVLVAQGFLQSRPHRGRAQHEASWSSCRYFRIVCVRRTKRCPTRRGARVLPRRPSMNSMRWRERRATLARVRQAASHPRLRSWALRTTW